MIQIIVCVFVCGIPAFTAASDDLCQNVTTTDDPCGITGVWVNQLNSTMVISCENGFLSGRYRSLVGVAENFYDLTGRYTMAGKDQDDVVLGWTISWNNEINGNSNSTSSWTGICYANEGTIHTYWILTRYKEHKDMWSSNMIGHDAFKRIC